MSQQERPQHILVIAANDMGIAEDTGHVVRRHGDVALGLPHDGQVVEQQRTLEFRQHAHGCVRLGQ